MLCRFGLRPHTSHGSLQHFRRTTDVLAGGALPGMEGERRDKWKGKGWREGHRVVCQGITFLGHTSVPPKDNRLENHL